MQNTACTAPRQARSPAARMRPKNRRKIRLIKVQRPNRCLVCGAWIADRKPAGWVVGVGICCPDDCLSAWMRGQG